MVFNALHIHVQVTVPALQGRFYHSSTAFNVSPGLIEVVLFGGCPEWPSNPRTDADLPQIANTTVLRFGECTSCVLYTSHVAQAFNIQMRVTGVAAGSGQPPPLTLPGSQGF